MYRPSTETNNKLYRFEWQSANREYFKLEIILSAQWGNYVPITSTLNCSSECILSIGSSKMSYSKIPIGMPEVANFKVKFWLNKIAGNADMNLLRKALLKPLIKNGIILTNATENPDSSNLFRFFHKAKASDPYTQYFEGVQRPASGRNGKIEQAGTNANRTELEVNLVSVHKYVLECVKIKTVQNRIQTYTSPHASDMFFSKTLIDYTYAQAGVKALQVQTEGELNSKAHLYSYADFVFVSIYLCGEIYRQLARDPAAYFFSAADVLGNTSNPYSNFIFYKQTHSSDSPTKGTALLFEQIFYLAIITYTSPSSGNTMDVAGLLFGFDENATDQQNLFRVANLYDYYKIASQSGLCKVRFILPSYSNYYIALGFYPIFDNSFTVLQNEDIDWENIEFEEGTKTISSAKTASPACRGADLADYSTPKISLEDNEELPLRLWWHNMPRVGEDSEVHAPTGYSQGVKREYKRFQPFSLYYRDPMPASAALLLPGVGVNNTSSEAAIRVHSIPDIIIRTDKAIKNNATINYKLHLAANTTSGEDIPLVRGNILESQLRDGFPAQIAKAAAKVFGNSSMTTFKANVRFGKIYPMMLGDTFQLGPNTDFSVWSGIPEFDISTKGILISCEPDIDSGWCKCEFLHLPFPTDPDVVPL